MQFIDKLEVELTMAQSAWETGHLEEEASIAHWLKGAGGKVGFDDFMEPAAKLQQFANAQQAAHAGQMLERLKHLSEAIEPLVMAHG